MTIDSQNMKGITHKQKDRGAVVIVPVHFSDDEPLGLQEGVRELLRLYCDELSRLGCDRVPGFHSVKSEWESNLLGKYDFRKGGGLFVAFNPGSSVSNPAHQVVGCIALRHLWEDPSSSSCAEIKRMCVRREYRRCGIAKQLAQAAIAHAWREGYGEIKLESLERLTGAIKLYERLGFQRVSPYSECFEDDHVCMGLSKKRQATAEEEKRSSGGKITTMEMPPPPPSRQKATILLEQRA